MIEWLIGILGGSGITIIAILLIFFIYPDKFEHWVAIFYRFLYSIPELKRRVDRSAVASSIQDSVNGVCERINKDSPDVLPHALKVQWVQSEDTESFIKKGEIVVRLKHYDNQDRNLVDSSLLYLKTGLLPNSKNYLDETLRKSCEFKVATQIFSARRDTGAYDYFMENEFNPAIKTNPDIKQDLQIIEDLDSVGFFSRVFLTEVKETGEKLLGTMPTPAVQAELRNFAKFLQTIANKGWDEDVPLAFEGVKVKVAVVLVAKKETIQRYGTEPYIRRISRCVREGYESIYVCGRGKKFVKKILIIRKEVEGKTVTVLRSYYPQIRAIKGILLVCQSNLRYLAQQRELREEVKQAMADIVPGIKNGEIEIVSIARIRDLNCKIAVRMASGEDVYKAMSECIGKNGERVNELKERLKDKYVLIIPWSDNIGNFIITTLEIEMRFVNEVEIDEENLVANVKVNSQYAYKKAIARAKSASDLTGYIIHIEGPTETEIMKTPEEELKEIIRAHVPEVEKNAIEIVKIARIKGIGSRVIVKWNDKYVSKNKPMASRTCYGHNNEYLRMIKQEIMGERIHFHEWHNDLKELIIRCLYPLKKSEVYSIDLDNESNKASITLKENTGFSPSLFGQSWLTLSERVTGWRIEIKNT